MSRNIDHDIAGFLRARYEEDERRAQRGYYSDTHWEMFTTQAHLGAWKAWREYYPREQWDASANDVIADAARDAIRERIAAHEADRTTRVLADVAAKRRILERHRPHSMGSCRVCEAPHWGVQVCDHCYGRAWPCPDVLDLAASFSSHPDYREEWRPCES